MDDEVGSHSEHCRLQRQPQHLRDRAEAARRVARTSVAREVGLIEGIPAPREMRDHAHGQQGFGVAPAPFDHGIARLRQLGRRLGRAECEPFGQDRQEDQNDRSNRRGHADPEMKNEADREIDRYPRQVEQRNWTKPTEERVDAVKISHRPGAAVAESHKRGQPDDRAVKLAAQALIEADADTSEDASSNEIEQPERGIKADRKDSEADQGRYTSAWQHPIVDLKHENRAREHENVAHGADHGGRDECAPTGCQGGRQLGRGAVARRLRHIGCGPHRQNLEQRMCRAWLSAGPSLPAAYANTFGTNPSMISSLYAWVMKSLLC